MLPRFLRLLVFCLMAAQGAQAGSLRCAWLLLKAGRQESVAKVRMDLTDFPNLTLDPKGVVQIQSQEKIVKVWRITEKTMDQLPPGTALVDARTLQPLIFGIDFFNLDAVDADGFLNYGFSEQVTEQPFVAIKSIQNLGDNRDYRPGDSRNSARKTIYGEFYLKELPPAARNYLKLNFHHWSASGGEWNIETSDDVQSTRIYHGFPKDYSLRGGNSYPVSEVQVFLGWDLDLVPARLAKFEKIADALGLPRPTGGAPREGNPFLRLKTQAQIEKFYQILTEQAGGLEAMVEKYRQTRDREGGGLQRALGLEVFRNLNQFYRAP